MPAGDKLPLQEIQHRFAGQTVNELQQNGGTITGDNGSPNDAGDPATAGIDVTDAVFSGFVLKNSSGGAGTFHIWVLWKGRSEWAKIYNVELSVADTEIVTDELKTRGWERVYFERTDGNGGSWEAFIEELK